MPAEVSDIKQFIEICRRKDAQCTCGSARSRTAQCNATPEEEGMNTLGGLSLQDAVRKHSGA